MPLNSPAHQMYAGLVRDGMSEKEAAKIAQEKTGLALRTGQPIRGKHMKLRRKYHGFYS